MLPGLRDLELEEFLTQYRTARRPPPVCEPNKHRAKLKQIERTRRQNSYTPQAVAGLLSKLKGKDGIRRAVKYIAGHQDNVTLKDKHGNPLTGNDWYAAIATAPATVRLVGATAMPQQRASLKNQVERGVSLHDSVHDHIAITQAGDRRCLVGYRVAGFVRVGQFAQVGQVFIVAAFLCVPDDGH